MGLETRCLARVDVAGVRREGAGAVLLEGDELIVRGAARVRIPRASIVSLHVDDGVLTVSHPDGTLTLTLGDDAERWRARLAEPPKPLIEKLDVKAGATVCLVAVDDAALLDALRARGANVVDPADASGCDVVFLAVERDADLPRIAPAAAMLSERGALWVVHPKGRGGVPDTSVFEAGAQAGLVATKVARWSATHSAEKLVRRAR